MFQNVHTEQQELADNDDVHKADEETAPPGGSADDFPVAPTLAPNKVTVSRARARQMLADIESMLAGQQAKRPPEFAELDEVLQGEQTVLPVTDSARRVHSRQVLASIRRMLDPPEPG